MEENRENLKKNIQRLVETVNRNAAGIALIVPAFVAVATSVVKYLTYIQIKGRTDYFSVPSSSIEVFNQNILFDILFSSIIIVVIFFNTYVFLSVCRRKDISLFKRVKLFFVAFGMVFFINFMVFLVSNEPAIISVCLTIFNFLNALISYLLCKIPRKKAKKKNDTDNNCAQDIEPFQRKVFRLAIYFTLVFALLGSLLYYNARLTAEKERTFRMIDDTHIVVYETKEIFYANKCAVHDGSIAIFTNIQRQYLKTDVETEWKTFSSVTLQTG